MGNAILARVWQHKTKPTGFVSQFPEQLSEMVTEGISARAGLKRLFERASSEVRSDGVSELDCEKSP